MRVDVSLEYRFSRTPDGAVWTDSSYARPYWSRYLDVFDRVRVVARVEDVVVTPPGGTRVDDDAVEVAAVPHYVGPRGYLSRWPSLRREVRAAVEPTDAVLMRVPSPLGAFLTRPLAAAGRPFGLEVVGNPHETFAAGSIDHPLRPLVRRWLDRQLTMQCRTAAAVGYVTESTLQRRYPPGPDAFTTHYSSIDLPEEAFVAVPPEPGGAGTVRLVTVAALDQLYKGTDVLIDAVALLASRGLDLSLEVVGDGRHRPYLERRAVERQVADRVTFAGVVPAGAGVRSRLDAADVFVLPSRTEGLPRALVEAMARGLPCIGSTAGGIPELLDADELVPPGDSAALAARIEELAADPARRRRLGARNLARAGRYERSRLRERRIELYSHLREVTERWLARHASST